MYSTNNPHGAGPSSRPIKPLPVKRNFITKSKPASATPITLADSASEPEIILIDSGSSDIEVIGVGLPRSTTTVAPPPPNPRKNTKPTRTEVIDLSVDVPAGPSLSAVINQRAGDGHYSDSDSIPEGFEPWEPTVPLSITRAVPVPKREETDETERDLAWHEPKMDWFREDCTGASSAGAFIEPAVRHYRRRPCIEMEMMDFSNISLRMSGRPRWIREKSKYGPPMEAIARLESSILYADELVPIPGMNAPRGAVNCIAQARGYIAVGRTYEEDAAYDGGGLALWKVETQKAQDIPAHITHQAPRSNRQGSGALLPERKQNSILALSFDPADNTSLLSAGHDNRVQLWKIDEDEDTITLVESRRTRRPGCMSFCPEGGIVAIGAADGLRLFDTTDSLSPGYHWGLKRKGQETVSIAWGANRSQRALVAGTQDDEGLVGRVVLIDVIASKMVRGMDVEACSTLSIDPSGTVIAFTGGGRDGKPRRHVLRMYDAHRTDWHPISVIGIPSSKTNTIGEVVEAMWSPDGIHLACARDDNTIDVFDTRWLGQRQSMLVFKHDTDSSMAEGENSELYGVQGVAWFGSDKLVSGGADHCVRVWDVRKDEESRVLATLGGAVGYLVGSEDPELFPIIAGDLLGNAYYLPNRQLVGRS
ncbi:hypothetical protein FRC06_002342 [Ceratobasidium sp. 370]|nr:hypothetical protein FRC06_002342 [Ceratobasidium sp. 370]